MKHPASRKPKRKAPPKDLQFSSKVFLVAVCAVGFGAIALLGHFVTSSGQRHSITKTVDQWKATYQLDERQASVVRDIELEFHGSGSAFSFPPRRSAEEVVEHHKKISELLPPEFRQQFLTDMKSGHQKH